MASPTTNDEETLIPMDLQDSFWLQTDSAENLMIVNCLIFFKQKLNLHHLHELLEVTLPTRFRSLCITDLSGKCSWMLDPNFDVRLHCYRLGLPDPGSDTELEEVLGTFVSKPLEKSKPLWEAILLEGYQGTGTCLLLRTHHVLGDGISLGKFFFQSICTHAEFPEHHHHHHHHQDDASQHLGWSNPLNLLMHPLATVSKIITIPEHLLKSAKATLSAAQKFANLPTDRNLFKPEKLGRLKRVAWTKEFHLDEMGIIRQRLGVTVNDFLLSVICSALREFTLKHQSDKFSINDEFKATLPFSLASPDNDDVGNHFAMLVIRFPLAIEDPLERLYYIKKSLDHIKHSSEPLLAYGTVTAISMLPQSLGGMARHFFTDKMSMTVSNVPGPSIPVKVIGEPVERMLFFLPASGDLAMTFSIFGYNRKISIGVVTDEHNPASSKDLVELVEKAYLEHVTLPAPSESSP